MQPVCGAGCQPGPPAWAPFKVVKNLQSFCKTRESQAGLGPWQRGCWLQGGVGLSQAAAGRLHAALHAEPSSTLCAGHSQLLATVKGPRQ